MSSMRKRQALYGYAPSANPEAQTLSCPDPVSGRTYRVPAGATYNNGGNMKFGLYPTVGKSVGFLNLLSSCCRNNNVEYKGIVIGTNNCSTA